MNDTAELARLVHDFLAFGDDRPEFAKALAAYGDGMRELLQCMADRVKAAEAEVGRGRPRPGMTNLNLTG